MKYHLTSITHLPFSSPPILKNQASQPSITSPIAERMGYAISKGGYKEPWPGSILRVIQLEEQRTMKAFEFIAHSDASLDFEKKEGSNAFVLRTIRNEVKDKDAVRITGNNEAYGFYKNSFLMELYALVFEFETIAERHPWIGTILFVSDKQDMVNFVNEEISKYGDEILEQRVERLLPDKIRAELAEKLIAAIKKGIKDFSIVWIPSSLNNVADFFSDF